MKFINIILNIESNKRAKFLYKFINYFGIYKLSVLYFIYFTFNILFILLLIFCLFYLIFHYCQIYWCLIIVCTNAPHLTKEVNFNPICG